MRRRTRRAAMSDAVALLLLAQSVLLTSAQQLPLLKDRRVSCNSNSMDVDFEFNTPFNGVIYPDNHWREECKWFGNSARQKVITIPLNTDPLSGRFCGVVLDEARGEFRVMLKISPVANLLVDGMMALDVRCLYNINDVTLTLPVGPNGAGIFISSDALRPQTQAGVVTGSGGSPFLQMAIREGHGVTGNVLAAATVGQRITLDIVMQDTTIYDFYVRDCYAHDGTKQPDASISIIDLDGCAVRLSRAVDAPVFVRQPQPGGEERGKHVYVHMYGFQFTTSQLVYFECQVKPCLGDCNRQGNCFADQRVKRQSLGRSRRQIAANGLGIEDLDPTDTAGDYNLTAVIRIRPQELVSVVPAAQSAADLRLAGGGLASSRSASTDICVNVSVAIAILVIFVLVCVVSLIIAIFVCQRAAKEGKGRGGSFFTPASTPASSVHRGQFSPPPSASQLARIRH